MSDKTSSTLYLCLHIINNYRLFNKTESKAITNYKRSITPKIKMNSYYYAGLFNTMKQHYNANTYFISTTFIIAM